MKYSVVIVAKNEAHIIGQTLEALRGHSDDIIVCDSGSVDDTVMISKQYGARTINVDWAGYGPTKNAAAHHAKHSWILSLDADEIPDATLLHAISQAKASNNTIFRIKTLNYFIDKPFKHAHWYPDYRYRLYPKGIKWNEAQVHEQVIIPEYFKIVTLDGHLHHKGISSVQDYEQKQIHYAKLKARQYQSNNRAIPMYKNHFGSTLKFLHVYLWQGAWKGGSLGLYIAKTQGKMIDVMISEYKRIKNGSN